MTDFTIDEGCYTLFLCHSYLIQFFRSGIPSSYRPDFRGLHDPMGYIMTERLHHVAGVNIPVPLNMFAPQTPLLPPYYGQPPPIQNSGNITYATVICCFKIP